MDEIEAVFNRKDMTFEEAVKYFKERVPVSASVFYRIAEKYRGLAFTVGGYTKAQILKRFYDEILAALEDGNTLSEFRSRMNEFLTSEGYEGLDPLQADLIFRTNIQTAYNVGHYYAVKGGFASDEQIGISGNSPELGDVGYPIHAEVDVWAENSYIGKCFLDCQFTGARSKHITDFKRTAAAGSAETWTLHVSYAEDSFTGYTAELSVDTAKSVVTQIVIRTANYTLTMTPA